ncbi:protein NRT1/ PTR FAMILY 2.7 [Cocos nucifera]|uniref:Protein NRT1/ PTR FAMILY 2.7 n=1 Tax=Cocos nucifera TaxID=13894 RepID=A0A8K0I5Y8_COCNU|nr:protein NRT1/ PTR FAMILY 2.7 [Cocos nucifera]
MAAGIGGTRFNLATLGANQFDGPRDQGTFFNWYFVALYVSAIMGQVGIVYIQDNSGWNCGFGLCAIVVVICLFAFLQGRRYYRHTDLKENPFVGLVNVVVLAVQRRKMGESYDDQCYYYELEDGDTKLAPRSLTPGFRFLNRAALVEPKAGAPTDGSTSCPGRPPCTVDQVEDLKSLLRLLPLVAAALPVSTIISTHSTLTTLQALAADRHLLPSAAAGPLLPAGSVTVFVLTTAALSLPLLDRAAFPAWRAIARHPPSPLQRIAVGHALNAVAIAGSALVEWSRLRALRSDPEPIWVMWLVPPLVLLGLGEAFHFPGQVALYYQEFPETLKSTATAMFAFASGIGFYLSSGLIALVQRMTGWLQDDVNESRLDNVYWMLAGVGLINFVYFLVCASLYKQRS